MARMWVTEDGRYCFDDGECYEKEQCTHKRNPDGTLTTDCTKDTWIGKAVNAAGKAFGDVPIIGGALSAVWSVGVAPFRLADDIAKGTRLDRALLAHIEREIANIKAIAPYAQMVISFVPGIGPIASAAIGTGLALAAGQRIDQALLEGVKGALPGGPLAKAAFEAGQGVLSGKPVEEIGIEALPIPAAAKQGLEAGARLTKQVASGGRVDDALMNEAIRALPMASQGALEIAKRAGGADLADAIMKETGKLVPENVRKHLGDALVTGMTMGQAAIIQAIAKKKIQAPDFQAYLTDQGRKAIGMAPSFQSVRNIVPGKLAHGVEIGIATMTRNVSINEIQNIREVLSPDDKKGFDFAMAYQIGGVLSKSIDDVKQRLGDAAKKTDRANRFVRVAQRWHVNIDPSTLRAIMAHQEKRKENTAVLTGYVQSRKTQLAYCVTRGLPGATTAQKAGLMSLLSGDAETRWGATVAIYDIAQGRKSWLRRLLEFLGFGKHNAEPIGPAPSILALPAKT